MFNCKEDDSFVKGNIIQLITFNEVIQGFINPRILYLVSIELKVSNCFIIWHIFKRPSLRRDVLWYTNVSLSVRPSVRPFHMSRSNFGIDGLTVCILYGEISNFYSRVMGLYSSNCRQFFVCRAVNWEPLRQFTSNFTQLLELIVWRSVYFLVKFRFFIPELWDFIHQIVGDFSYVAL